MPAIGVWARRLPSHEPATLLPGRVSKTELVNPYPGPCDVKRLLAVAYLSLGSHEALSRVAFPPAKSTTISCLGVELV